MAQTKLYGRDLKAYQDVDLDDLLSKLTDAELEELHTELIDPDDSMVPPSDRCRYKTDKAPTGPFSRKHLLDYLETKAREDKDWDEAKPYKKEIRGKVWKPKEEEKVQINEDVKVETEWDEVLAQATEEELVDLAAILGFHGMLNQVQYHQAFVEGGDMKGCKGGFQGVAKYSDFKVYEDEPPNSTDVDASLQQLKNNDAKLKELNLNNIKNISIERLCEIAETLRTNTHLEKLHLSNTRATDKVANALAGALAENKTLKLLNLESNYISGQAIVNVLSAINVNQAVTEFRVSNQRPQLLGIKTEMAISLLMRENMSLLRFGIFLEVRTARIHVTQYLQRNSDNLRRGRVGAELLQAPVEHTPYYLKKSSSTADTAATPAVAAAAKNDEAAAKKPEDEKKKEEESEEESEEEESDEEEE
jgi:tropomodulin